MTSLILAQELPEQRTLYCRFIVNFFLLLICYMVFGRFVLILISYCQSSGHNLTIILQGKDVDYEFSITTGIF